MLALASGFSWIGRGYAYNVKELVELIQQAIKHPGLSYLDVLQPCPTYNDLHTKDWFAGKGLDNEHSRLYSLKDEDYDPVIPQGVDEQTVNAKMAEFMTKAHEWGDRIPTGVFLDNRSLSTFEERIAERIPGYRKSPPARRVIADAHGHPTTDLSKIFAEVAVT
jgi:2-oxoglutarate ferredoxin oxidoreductase subunit beta